MKHKKIIPLLPHLSTHTAPTVIGVLYLDRLGPGRTNALCIATHVGDATIRFLMKEMQGGLHRDTRKAPASLVTILPEHNLIVCNTFNNRVKHTHFPL